jgi:hypothetical protein
VFFIAALAAVFIVLIVQARVYKKHQFDHLEYRAWFSSGEAYAGDDVYLYEEITNTGRLPLPYIKIETDLPKGLEFILLGDAEAPSGPPAKKRKRGVRVSASVAGEASPAADSGGLRKESRTSSVQSIFVLRPYARIRRRWRINCRRRGDYLLEGALCTGNNLLGSGPQSVMLKTGGERPAAILVLPRPGDLEGHYASSRFLCGDCITNLGPVSDPTRLCGSREYSVSDPMNRVNWKSTAVHGKLMSNIEEKTLRHRFSVLLNMNSREIEPDPLVPSIPDALERCMIICTSILDRIAAEDVPVRLFANYPPEDLEGGEAVGSDATGSLISTAGPFRGKRDMLYALRTIARVGMKISVPADKMFDHIAANPGLYNENENLIIISSYIDGRMMNLAEALRPAGVRVIFYIATSRNNVGEIPDGADVYFSLG